MLSFQVRSLINKVIVCCLKKRVKIMLTIWNMVQKFHEWGRVLSKKKMIKWLLKPLWIEQWYKVVSPQSNGDLPPENRDRLTKKCGKKLTYKNLARIAGTRVYLPILPLTGLPEHKSHLHSWSLCFPWEWATLWMAKVTRSSKGSRNLRVLWKSQGCVPVIAIFHVVLSPLQLKITSFSL